MTNQTNDGALEFTNRRAKDCHTFERRPGPAYAPPRAQTPRGACRVPFPRRTGPRGGWGSPRFACRLRNGPRKERRWHRQECARGGRHAREAYHGVKRGARERHGPDVG